MEQKYKVTQEIHDIRANLDGKPVFVDIPVGTICTEENYGRGDITFVFCTIGSQVYHDIAFPPFIFEKDESDKDNGPYVEIIPNGGRRKKKTKTKTKKRRTTKRRTTTKRHHKTRRSY
jgi:hypothetical protein